MIYLKYLAVAALINLASISLATANSTSDSEPGDYWKKPEQKWALKLAASRPMHIINIYPSGQDDYSVSYESNTLVEGLVTLSYQGLGSLSYSVGELNDRSPKTYGESDHRDYQIRLYQNGMGLELIHQKYRGFYSEDTNQDIRVRDSLASTKTSLAGIYFLSQDRLSMEAAFSLSTKQLRSGGSWILYGVVNRQKLKADGGLADQELLETNPDLKKLAEVQGLETFDVGLGGGYGHTWVFWRRFYINTTWLLAPAAQHQNLVLVDNSSQSNWNPAFLGSLKLSLGYNGKRHFAGFEGYVDSQTSYLDGGEVTTMTVEHSVFYGFRF